MARTVNDGKVFETMVGVISRSLIGRSATVHQRHFMRNMYEIDREIDMFIQTPTLNIVIECKDWRSKSKRIKLELIDAFHGKTSVIPGINRRIFVARGKYQRGAKRLAEGLNIKLYTLDEIDLSTIQEWFEWNQAKQLKIDWHVTNIALKSKEAESQFFIAVHNGHIINVEGVGSDTVDEIIRAHVDNAMISFQEICLRKYHQGEARFLWFDFIDWNGPVVTTYFLEANTLIQQIYFCLNIEITDYSVKEVNAMGYDDILNDEQTAVSASVSYRDQTVNKIHFVKLKESNSLDAYIEEIIAGQMHITPLISRDVPLDD